MYGGAMLPPHPPMAEGPGGPLYNGLHAGDPAWSPIIKVVPNNADNSDPQQQVKSLLVKTLLCNHMPKMSDFYFCHQCNIASLSH